MNSSKKTASQQVFFQALLLLSLSFIALSLISSLKPHDPQAIQEGEATSAAEGRPARSLALRSSPSRSPESPSSPSAASTQAAAFHETQASPSPIASPSPSPPSPAAEDEARVTVLEPGKIALSAAQADALRGAGSWGQASPEARAFIETIPNEAFTSDW